MPGPAKRLPRKLEVISLDFISLCVIVFGVLGSNMYCFNVDPTTKKKKHREVVTGKKVHALVGMLGRPIALDYDANTEEPTNSALADMFTRYLGAKVRDKAKMLSPTWSESLQEHREIITLAMSLCNF